MNAIGAGTHEPSSLRLQCFFLALCLCGSALSCSDRSSPRAETRSDGAPAIRFDSTHFDFGTVFQQEQARHTFTFTNEGSAPLSITHVKATCGCTIPLYTKDPVPAGQSGTVEVIFDSGTRQGDITKDLTVQSNDPEQPTVKLAVKGTIKREMWLAPIQADFGNLREGQQPEARTMKVCWLPEVNVNVTDIDTTHEAVRVVTQEPFVSEGVRGVEVSFRLENWADALEGSNLRHYLVVNTDHPKYRQLTFPVTAKSSKPLEISPRYLAFGVVRSGNEVEKKVRITALPGTDARLERFETPPFIEVTANRREENQADSAPSRFDLKVKLMSNAPTGSFKESLKIHTNLKEQPVLTLYVLGNVK